MCLKAKDIFDSDDLLTRNHVLHWILSRIYLETNDMISLDSELKEMQYIIRKNNIDQFNYNMIFKFYQDIRIHKYFMENKIDSARMLIELFDKDIYDKVKEWNYPFDIAFFNTEFGKLVLNKDELELCKERIDKALEYNNKYPFAHLALACYYAKKNQPSESLYFWNEFSRATRNADPEAKDLVRNEFRKFTNSRN